MVNESDLRGMSHDDLIDLAIQKDAMVRSLEAKIKEMSQENEAKINKDSELAEHDDEKKMKEDKSELAEHDDKEKMKEDEDKEEKLKEPKDEDKEEKMKEDISLIFASRLRTIASFCIARSMRSS